MSPIGALLRDLETTLARESEDDRAVILSRLTDLFLSTADGMAEDQIGVFDVVIGRLARAIESRARVELSERLAPVASAPSGVIRQLALDDIAVARPVLVASPRLSDRDLVAIASAKGRDHMLAITERADLGEPVTDFLILRGGRVVTHAVAANQSARFSRHGMGVLVMRAAQDDALQATLGTRADIPEDLTSQLMEAAKASARRRLEASLEPTMAEAVAGAVARSAETVEAHIPVGDSFGRFGAALAQIRMLDESGALDEAMIAAHAEAGRAEHAICGLAVLTGLSLPSAEQIVMGPDREAVLLIARGMDWGWPTARSLIGLRKSEAGSAGALERAQRSFDGLAPMTARRVLGFLRMRDGAQSDSSAHVRI